MRPIVIAVLSVFCPGSVADEPRAPAPRTSVAGESPAPAPSIAATDAPLLASSAGAEAPAVAVADPREATRRAAHDALAEHCGECHESHRPTAKPAALAIFDLDLPDWPARFNEHRYESALKRLASKPAARDAFLAFRDAERGALR